MYTQNMGRASALMHHGRSIRDSNDQTTLQEPVLPSQSNASVYPPCTAVQQFGDQMQRGEPPHEHPDPHSDKSIEAEVAGPPLPCKNNIQEDVSKQILRGSQPNEMGSPHITDSETAGIVEVGIPQNVSIPNHGTSRAPSEIPSRPQSRRSNCGNKITRPLTAQDLRPQGILEAAAERTIQSMKIKKPGNAPSNPTASEASVKPAVASGHQREATKARPKFFQEYKAFLDNAEQLLEFMEDYDLQSKKIEAQKTEIKKLRDTSDSAINQVRALEKEKADLTDKLKRFSEISSKYKKHMNDVIISQKYLKSQAQEIQKSTRDAVAKTRLAVENHATLVKIEEAVKKAKDILISQEILEKGKLILSCSIGC